MKQKWNFNDLLNSSIFRRIVITLIVAGFIGIGINAGYRATRNTDFNDYYDAAKAFRNGKLVFEIRGYKYPQFFAIIFSPFTFLPPFLSAIIWYLMNIFFLACSVILSIKIVNNNYRSDGSILYIIPLLITSLFLIDNLMLGQVNILILFLICSTFYCFKIRRDYLAGIFLACSISIRITPLLFLLYFLYKKQYKIIAGVIIGLIIFLLIFPSVFLGFEKNTAELKGWSNKMLVPFISEGKVILRFNNQSLPAALNRFLRNVNAGKTKNPIYVNILDLNKATVNKIVLISNVLIILTLLLLCRSNSSDRNNPLLPFEFSSVLMATLFISATSWTFHFSLLLFPYIVGMNFLLKEKKTSLPYKLMLGSIIASSFFYLLTISDLMRALSCILAGALVFWIGTVAVMYQQAREHESGRQEFS
ncbi:MAG: hypothetical protein A2W05_04805 [Candidatus Schekmanbacteria bacterium RBG_16_38_10]|uniref:DUF2029 domain-containing protein n=1 Tax=Candidatus Schekmanbacteria bacterium RBG_16_38_10 TaxID=1817879 RepID=A0A1F7RR07_9BACT|nr:MAG: hypothetical protein A2W05_04805 [Candidatus Schekmanbacteria bacterium RBG_16_38_10]